MRKLMAGLLVLAVMCMVVSTALAEPVIKTEELQWRHHRIAGTTAAYSYARYDEIGPYSDSVSFNRVVVSGATLGVAAAETSTVFLTEGKLTRALPGAVILDSLMVMRVYVHDAGATATSIDSTALAVQVSPDGKNWLWVAPLLGTAGASPFTTTAPKETWFQLLNLSGATTSTPKVFMFPVSHYVTTTGSMYPDRNNFWMWPAIRFIYFGPHVTGSAIQNFKITVQYWGNP